MIRKGVVFDFDGVIINSINVQKQAFYGSYIEIVKDNQAPFEEFLSHSGDSLENIFKKMGLPREMLEPYTQISKNKINEIEIYEGMKELLIKLKSKGVYCGLLTGKDRERTIKILYKLSLYKYFDAIVCSDDLKNPKPHKEGLEVCGQIMELYKENLVMIGDAKNDIECSRNAGVKSIAVTWGATKEEDIKKELPDFIASSAIELEGILNGVLY